VLDLKGATKEIKELSEKYGLAVDPSAKVEDISVGAQQRVEILKTLYRGADILIFDEPTAVLTPAEIDELNILHASMLAMERAVKALKIQPHFVLVDGNRIPPNLGFPAQAVVKGDSLVAEISAASILAKVARDQDMEELDKNHPEYAFAQHKGYPTKLHLEKLAELGPLPEYRRSFSPVKKALGIED